MATTEVLDNRRLNRATLARQWLLERADVPVEETLEHLVGMQAQEPQAPYIGLWSRLAGFDPGALTELIDRRAAVRAPLMRGTLHLVTARDLLALRPLVQPVLERVFAGQPAFRRAVEGIELADVLAAGRELLDERPLTRAQLGPLLAERWPGRDPAALAMAVTFHVPLVQVPPRGLWRASGPAAWAVAETWLGEELDREPSVDAMVLRYLAAYGPSTVADIRTWCRVTGLREVVDRLRPRLRVFRTEAGREVFDLPDAPRPPADTPAAVRLLPEYDNVLLSHADRTRFVAGGAEPPLPPAEALVGTVLADGVVAAWWRIVRNPRVATLAIDLLAPLAAADLEAVATEAQRLLDFAAEEMTTRNVDVRLPG